MHNRFDPNYNDKPVSILKPDGTEFQPEQEAPAGQTQLGQFIINYAMCELEEGKRFRAEVFDSLEQRVAGLQSDVLPEDEDGIQASFNEFLKQGIGTLLYAASKNRLP